MKRIPLTQGKVALVDDADFERLNRWKWCAKWDRGVFYAVRPSPGGGTVLMHREVLNAPLGVIVDHRNQRNLGEDFGLDNQQGNLRLATNAQNIQNQRKTRGTSRFKGVYWNRARGKWHAGIRLSGVRKHLGYFDGEEDAARAYDQAARKLFREFARLNFPNSTN